HSGTQGYLSHGCSCQRLAPSSNRFARIAQPLVQLAASIAATALFPVILLFLIHLRGGVEIAAMPPMLLGTQWSRNIFIFRGKSFRLPHWAAPRPLRPTSSLHR